MTQVQCKGRGIEAGASKAKNKHPGDTLHFIRALLPDFLTPLQALDGKFGDGKSEAHGKYSAKEGVRPNQARPQTNIQVTRRKQTNIQTFIIFSPVEERRVRVKHKTGKFSSLNLGNISHFDLDFILQ